MSMSDDELRRARARSAAARETLTRTIVEIQHRLSPRVLMEEAGQELREKAVDLFDQGIAQARARPGVVAAIGAALLAYLLRGPIFRALWGLITQNGETEPDEQALTARAISRAAARPPEPEEL